MHEIVMVSGAPEVRLARALDRRGWARDLAIVGASTAALVPALLGLSAGFAIVSGAIGGALAMLLGRAIPDLLAWRIRRIPMLVLALAGAGVGANWGVMTGWAAAAMLGSPWIPAVDRGATIGLLQLGWFWIPAIWLRARGLPTWPLVALAIALCPVIAAATVL